MFERSIFLKLHVWKICFAQSAIVRPPKHGGTKLPGHVQLVHIAWVFGRKTTEGPTLTHIIWVNQNTQWNNEQHSISITMSSAIHKSAMLIESTRGPRTTIISTISLAHHPSVIVPEATRTRRTQRRGVAHKKENSEREIEGTKHNTNT